jgi:chromosome partitioning protein
MPDRTVIAIINEKGGTAKTTTAVSLSAALGDLGQRVLLVDLDGQAAASRWLGVEEDNRLADALCRGGGLEPVPDVLPGVSLVPASGKLDSVAHDLRPTQGGQLRKVLNDLTGFDFVIIDCPPSLGNRLIANGLLAATHALVPVETSILALDGLKILLTTLDDIRDGFGHDIILAGVLACRFDGRTRLSHLVLEELKRALPGKVFGTVIRENVRMRECPASGQSILMFAPDSPAAQDYRSLAGELLAQPQAWRKPATNLLTGGDAGGGQFSVGNLRENAAASVRDSVKKAPWRRNAEAAEAAEVALAQPPEAPAAQRDELPAPEPAAELPPTAMIAPWDAVVGTQVPADQPSGEAIAPAQPTETPAEQPVSAVPAEPAATAAVELMHQPPEAVGPSEPPATAVQQPAAVAVPQPPANQDPAPWDMPLVQAPSPVTDEQAHLAAAAPAAAPAAESLDWMTAVMAGQAPAQPGKPVPPSVAQQALEPVPAQPEAAVAPGVMEEAFQPVPAQPEAVPPVTVVPPAPAAQDTPPWLLETAPPQPVGPAKGGPDQYPALRAYLEKMRQEHRIPQDAQQENSAAADGKKAGFMGLFRKPKGNK